MQMYDPTVDAQLPKVMPVSGLQIPSAQTDFTPASDAFSALAHDARNMLAALDLYCDLLGEPGVLSPDHHHYSRELKMIAASSRRLVEKMGALGMPRTHSEYESGESSKTLPLAGLHDLWPVAVQAQRWKDIPEVPISNLAEELRGCQNLLSALAGALIQVNFDICECALPVQMTGEDLTRVLVNLVKNAREAMTGEGRIRISLREYPTETGTNRRITLKVEDNGPGIPRDALETIFESGYTTRGVSHEGSTPGSWPVTHRGMGLTITRAIVEKAGGSVHAAARDPFGACFQVELPVSNAL
jgi:signal transduction histidine kinase